MSSVFLNFYAFDVIEVFIAEMGDECLPPFPVVNIYSAEGTAVIVPCDFEGVPLAVSAQGGSGDALEVPRNPIHG